MANPALWTLLVAPAALAVVVVATVAWDAALSSRAAGTTLASVALGIAGGLVLPLGAGPLLS